jgi:hypothetical protein
MLEVANFEHARFGVLSQCYSFRHFTATDPIPPFNTSSGKYIPAKRKRTELTL